MANVSLALIMIAVTIKFNKNYIKMNHRESIINTEHSQYKNLIDIKSILISVGKGVLVVMALLLVQFYYEDKSPVPALVICISCTYNAYTYSRNPKVLSYFLLYLRQQQEGPRLWHQILLPSQDKVLPLPEAVPQPVPLVT